MIIDDDSEKKIECNNVIFIMSGTVADFDSFIESYFAGKNITDSILNIYAFIIDDGQLYDASIGDNRIFWKCKKRMDIHYAGGSGEKCALTAMDMGASAEDAIKMTMKRDVNTGGKIRIFKLDNIK